MFRGRLCETARSQARQRERENSISIVFGGRGGSKNFWHLSPEAEKHTGKTQPSDLPFPTGPVLGFGLANMLSLMPGYYTGWLDSNSARLCRFMVMFALWDGPVWLERCASNLVLHIDYIFCLNRVAQYIKLSESVALVVMGDEPF